MKRGMKQKAERRISATLRIILATILLALQIAVIILLSRLLTEHVAYIYLLMNICAFIAALFLLNRPGSPSYKINWLLIILPFPLVGPIFFLLWGGPRQAKRLNLKQLPPLTEGAYRQKESRDNIIRMGREYPNWQRLSTYLHRNDFLLYQNTDAAYFADGKDYFGDMMRHMQQAKRFIFLEYYILAEGKLWDQMLEILRDRARNGVEIKIIFDDFGNITRLSGEMLKKMDMAGIDVKIFNPVHQYVNRLYFNYRDHRKMAAIDGDFVYTGGLNIGDEYVGLVDKFGQWKDGGIRLEGEGAWGLTSQFIHMWYLLGGETHNERDYYRSHETQPKSNGFCQTMVDGPTNNPENPVEDAYMQLITSAKRMLYMTTPYFAVEEYMVQALCMAAKGGVDVHLMMPGKSDHWFIPWLAETYYGDLLKSGVKIYLYQEGFLHQKNVMVDREVALVGTVNMDYRSFQLQYECGTILYGSTVVEDVLEDMEKIVEVSREYTMAQWEKRSKFRKTVGHLLRLFAIWM